MRGRSLRWDCQSRRLCTTLPNNPALGLYFDWVTWGELIRRLKAAAYVEQRTGKGSHRQFVHQRTGHIITIAVHTKKEVGSGLANRILKEAGLK